MLSDYFLRVWKKLTAKKYVFRTLCVNFSVESDSRPKSSVDRYEINKLSNGEQNICLLNPLRLFFSQVILTNHLTGVLNITCD